MLEQSRSNPVSVESRREMFVGKTALEIVPLLIASMPEVETVGIISYQRGFSWTEGYPSIEVQLAEGLAESFPVDRKVALSPDYWEKMVEQLKEIYIPPDYPADPEEVALLRKDLEEDEEEDREVYLSLSSQVRTVGRRLYNARRQIPLMDFKCVPSASSLSLVKSSLIESGEDEGIILHSGQSYHYYGLRTISLKKWGDWMKAWFRNTWTWPWVDRKFVARSLEDGYNFLRLTSGVSKPAIPIVVDVI